MTNLLLEILTPLLGTITTALGGVVAWFVKQKKKEYTKRKELEYRQAKINESYNKAAGFNQQMLNMFNSKTKDNDYAIKLDPDVRESVINGLEEVMKDYHKHDLK